MIHLGSMNSIANDLLQKVPVWKNWKATGESSRQHSGEQGRRENGRRHRPGQAQNFTEVLQGMSRVELLRKHACIGVLKPLF